MDYFDVINSRGAEMKVISSFFWLAVGAILFLCSREYREVLNDEVCNG